MFYGFPDIVRKNLTMRDIDRKRLKKFGLHLKKLRQKSGLSMRQLAARCDVDYAKISKLENNKETLELTTLFELAVGLDVHPTELLNFEFE